MDSFWGNFATVAYSETPAAVGAVAFVAGIDGFFLDMTIFSCTILLGRTAMLSKEIVGQK
jgi:hypothetical protein